MAFRFAPLQGETFKMSVRMDVPDTMIVRRQDGSLLFRSDAWIYILRVIGGPWKLLSGIMRLIPRPLRDLCYNALARIRSKLFRSPDSLCPIIPPQWRGRFEP
jgi:predicted DCC family thiol-disulfide oxidoreductase YuxK